MGPRLGEEHDVARFQPWVVHQVSVFFVALDGRRAREVTLVRATDDAEAAVARRRPGQRHGHREEPVVHAALVPGVRQLVAPCAVVVHLAAVEHESVCARRLLDEQR